MYMVASPTHYAAAAALVCLLCSVSVSAGGYEFMSTKSDYPVPSQGLAPVPVLTPVQLSPPQPTGEAYLCMYQLQV